MRNNGNSLKAGRTLWEWVIYLIPIPVFLAALCIGSYRMSLGQMADTFAKSAVSSAGRELGRTLSRSLLGIFGLKTTRRRR